MSAFSGCVELKKLTFTGFGPPKREAAEIDIILSQGYVTRQFITDSILDI